MDTISKGLAINMRHLTLQGDIMSQFQLAIDRTTCGTKIGSLREIFFLRERSIEVEQDRVVQHGVGVLVPPENSSQLIILAIPDHRLGMK